MIYEYGYRIPLNTKTPPRFLWKQGLNALGLRDYRRPCPPSRTHRYFFKIYALDKILGLKEGISKEELEEAIEGHVLDKVQLIGLYKKQ